MTAGFRIARIFAHSQFFRVTGQDYDWNKDSRYDMDHELRQLDRRLIAQVTKFIKTKRERHKGVSASIIRIIFRGNAEPRLRAVMKHFDYTHELGWKYQGDVVTLIDKVLISDRDGLTMEQERALIALEDSHWDKQYVYDRAYREPQYAYGDFVSDVAVSRPQDIDRIIAIVQTGTVRHAGHLEAILDGYGAPTLAEGAL
jgi:hypothetical protein